MKDNIEAGILIGLLLVVLILVFGARFFMWLSVQAQKLSDKAEAKADELEKRRKEKGQ